MKFNARNVTVSGVFASILASFECLGQQSRSQKCLSTVHEVPDDEEEMEVHSPPPRPPPPVLFPDDSESAQKALENIPEAPTDEPQINMTKRPPKLYELVQLSQDESFDMGNEARFVRQDSSSFWWDQSTEDNLEANVDEFAYPSVVSATIYHGTRPTSGVFLFYFAVCFYCGKGL